MPVHYFVRLRPPPGDGRGIRELTIGGRLFSADVGWVLLDRAEAVALRTVYHPDEKARYTFSYAFDVADVVYPDVVPDWIISAGQPADARYYAELVMSQWNEFVAFPYAGHVFKANTGWLPVTREQAEFLQLTHSLLRDPRSPRAFGVRVKPAIVRAPALNQPAAVPVVDMEFEPRLPTPLAPAPGAEGGRAVAVARSADLERVLKARLRAEILAELETERTAAVKPPSPPELVPPPGPSADSNQIIATPEDPDVDESDPEGPDNDADVELDAALNAGTIPLEERVLASLRDGPLSTTEIARALELKGVPGGLKRTVRTLLGRATIELTIPDKPGSRFQQYRLVQGATPSTMPVAADPAAHADVPASAAEAPLEAHQNAAELAGVPDAPMTSPHADASTVVARVIDGGRGADGQGAGLPANRESAKA